LPPPTIAEFKSALLTRPGGDKAATSLHPQPAFGALPIAPASRTTISHLMPVQWTGHGGRSTAAFPLDPHPSFCHTAIKVARWQNS